MSTPTKKPAFVRSTTEGKTFNVLGHSITAKVFGNDSSGDYYAFEVISPAGLGIPPHVHEHEDEVILVVEGTFEVWIDGKTYPAPAGSVFHFPRFTPHGFQNVGTTTGRSFWNVMPGQNFERFFDELGALPAGPPDMAKVAAIFGKYHIDILPPPPGA
jgi:quercetin dioxygenase-like cupin family protein